MLPGAVECLQLLLDARAELDLKDSTASIGSFSTATDDVFFLPKRWEHEGSLRVSTYPKINGGYELVVFECF